MKVKKAPQPGKSLMTSEHPRTEFIDYYFVLIAWRSVCTKPTTMRKARDRVASARAPLRLALSALFVLCAEFSLHALHEELLFIFMKCSAR